MPLEHNPYAAPTADTGVIESEPTESFRPLGRIGMLASLAIACVILLRGLFVGLDYYILTTVRAIQNGEMEPSEELAASVNLSNATVIWAMKAIPFFFLASGVITLIWIHRAHSNLPALGNISLQHTPGWCVGYWLIPFVCLVRPYQATCELVNGSDPEQCSPDLPTMPRQSGTVLLGFWWLFWLLMVFFAHAARNIGETEDPDTVMGVNLLGTVLITISGLLTITVIRRVKAFQEQRRELILAPESKENSAFQSGPAW